MIMVDVMVPAIGRTYNFNLDETAKISELIAEIAEVICQKESCMPEGRVEQFCICSMEQAKILSADASLRQYGITYGNRLMLV